MPSLHELWLSDQRLALAAAILCGNGEDGLLDSGALDLLAQAAKVVSVEAAAANLGYLADATLALVSKIPACYVTPDAEEFPGGVSLVAALDGVNKEVVLREDSTKRMSAIHISHAVYLMRQSHLSIRDFFKWLTRSGRNVAPGVPDLPADESGGKQLVDTRVRLDGLLALSRTEREQARDRVDAVDAMHEAVIAMMGGPADRNAWWTRICLALRNSLFCWPLMIAGDGPDRRHGISLPIGLFLSPDGKGKTYFRIIHSKEAPPSTRRFQLPSSSTGWFASMEGSQLAWDRDWGLAPGLGMEVAKALWRTQNGRLRFADEESANERLLSSLVVDMGPASEIVDSVFKDLPGRRYVMTGRSAEAYWVQVVLGMLLPEGQMPYGVVTGRIEEADGAFEIRWVEGIEKKLEYANNAGFSRVILPGSEADEVPLDMASGAPPGTRDRQRVEQAVSAFLEGLTRSRRMRTTEINFCPTARSAADAMQPSGWRRTAFVRLPATQRVFSFQLRRLFVQTRHSQGMAMSQEDRDFLKSDPWTGAETAAMEALDSRLLSRNHAIRFIDRASFDTDAELVIGKWLAWKDNQVRSGMGPQTRMRAPGLGILCLRTTATDNEMRLWSTVADVLSADSAWWKQFQWSDRDKAARVLGDLLNNLSADPSICATSAPDIVVIFDEGNFTQRRTNRIFPDDFRGQMTDLLNPRKEVARASDPLDDALLRAGVAASGCLGPTRLLVIYGTPRNQEVAIPQRIAPEQLDHLARLAVFRFGISRQAAYSMLNFGRAESDRLEWTAARAAIEELIDLRAVYSTRGQLYVKPEYLPGLRQLEYANDPRAHLHAAKALASILEPQRVFVATNRDRTLEPEPMLEAIWHLYRARQLTTARDFSIKPQCDTALATLVFLRTYPDWDTVKELEKFAVTRHDAVELGRELLQLERWVTGTAPHTSRVAALLHAMGRHGGTDDVDAADRIRLAEEACARMHDGMTSLEALNVEDARRQKRKLLSEFVYCMKALEVPDSDSRLTGAFMYLNKSIEEILRPDLYADLDTWPDKLDTFPLSRDWFKIRWEDANLPLATRSRYAYAASRLYIGQRVEGEQVRAPWDQPWIEYFALTSPADLDPPQLKNPLATWQDIYGGDIETARGFGRRVRDMFPYRSKTRAKKEKISWWRRKVQNAVRNLWAIVQLPPEQALAPRFTDIALRFIDVVVMGETMPAFEFLDALGDDWIPDWPRRRTRTLPGWQVLAGSVLSSHAGWVTMLAKIDVYDPGAPALACAWLREYLDCGGGLTSADPEDLLNLPGGSMEIVDRYRRRRQQAIWNGYQLLACGNEQGAAVRADYKQSLQDILGRIDARSNSWFFAIANGEPHRRVASGASLMLRDVSPESIELVRTAPKLQPFRNSIVRKIPQWINCAAPRDRRVFMDLGESMRQ